MPTSPYAEDDIRSADIAHVRNNPGMYFGNNSEYGLIQAVRELVSNGIDLCLQRSATRVDLRIEGDLICYSDDGHGLPFDVPSTRGNSLAEQYLTRRHLTPTADNHAPHIHLGGFGLGMFCVNAVSETFSIKSWRSGRLWEQNYLRGIPVDSPIVVEEGELRGTQIHFRLDGLVFSTTTPPCATIRQILFEATHLFPGIKLGFNDEVFYAPNGLADLAKLLQPVTNLKDDERVFSLHVKRDDVEIDVGIVGQSDDDTDFRSWANGSKTISHGTHVLGLRDALRAVKWEPAIALIHVILHQPEFASPTRDLLDNNFVRKVVRDSLKPALLTWMKNSPQA